MGAWGETVFENDSAQEWAEQLASQLTTTFILRPLRSIAKARGKAVLEADRCECALAAAEVIAAAHGHPCRGLPDEIRDWLKEREFVPGAGDVQLARDAVTRIAGDSELLELWANDKVWTGGVRKLVERLSRSPKSRKVVSRKGTQKKTSVPQQTDAATVKLSEIRKIAKQRKGGLAVVKGEPYYLGFDGAILKDLIAIGNCPECHLLRQLEISGRGITDPGLEHIGRLTKLRELELDAPCVTDVGIAFLRSLSGLEELTLKRTQMTDAGLEQLASLKALRFLRVHGSAVSPAALNKLASQGCRVSSDVLK